MLKQYKEDLNKSVEHSYFSTQVNLSPKKTKRVIDWIKKNIPADEWYFGENETGIEEESHVTVLYGIKNKKDYSTIKKILKQNKLNNLIAYLEHLSVFECNGYDVLMVTIDDIDNDFKNANKLIKDNVDCKITHPNYTPHMTLAYMKKGTAEKYKGMKPFDNMVINGPVLFCGKDESKRILKSLS